MPALRTAREFAEDLDVVTDYCDDLFETACDSGDQYPAVLERLTEMQDVIFVISEIRSLFGKDSNILMDMLMEKDVREYLELYRQHNKAQSLSAVTDMLARDAGDIETANAQKALHKQQRDTFLKERSDWLTNVATANYLVSQRALENRGPLN